MTVFSSQQIEKDNDTRSLVKLWQPMQLAHWTNLTMKYKFIIRRHGTQHNGRALLCRVSHISPMLSVVAPNITQRLLQSVPSLNGFMSFLFSLTSFQKLKKYVCAFCDESFARTDGYYRHMAKYHPNKEPSKPGKKSLIKCVV